MNAALLAPLKRRRGRAIYRVDGDAGTPPSDPRPQPRATLVAAAPPRASLAGAIDAIWLLGFLFALARLRAGVARLRYIRERGVPLRSSRIPASEPPTPRCFGRSRRAHCVSSRVDVHRHRGGPYSEIQIYDASGRRTALVPMPLPRWSATATLLRNGEVLIRADENATGGLHCTLVYDPALHRFTKT